MKSVPKIATAAKTISVIPKSPYPDEAVVSSCTCVEYQPLELGMAGVVAVMLYKITTPMAICGKTGGYAFFYHCHDYKSDNAPYIGGFIIDHPQIAGFCANLIKHTRIHLSANV